MVEDFPWLSRPENLPWMIQASWDDTKPRAITGLSLLILGILLAVIAKNNKRLATHSTTLSRCSWLAGLLTLLYAGFRAIPRSGQFVAFSVFGTLVAIVGTAVGTAYVFHQPSHGDVKSTSREDGAK